MAETAEPDGGSVDWVPEACTLPGADRPLRLAEFDQVFATAVPRSVRSPVPPRTLRAYSASRYRH